MTTILIVRHGQTDWNLDHHWQGHADPPLNKVGRAQARELAEHLCDVRLDAVFASDLRRSSETAEAVARTKGLSVVTDPSLREIDVGEWSGLTTDEIQARFSDGWRRHGGGGDGWEHGETHAAMSERIVAAVAQSPPSTRTARSSVSSTAA